MFARFLIAAGCAASLAATLILADQSPLDLTILPLDHAAIRYAGPAADAVTRLDAQIASGKVKLEYRAGLGYLPALLARLGINPDSQSLVFSKTSFQAAKISPSNPRALFFNDEVMVGSVRGGDVLELAALDPKQGMVFYTLDVQKSDQPRFVRRDSCLQCHQGPATLGIPGVLVGSVFPDASGMPNSRMGNPVTDDSTPIQKRWGGWYVTGTTGGMNHLGNAVARDPRAPDVLDERGSQNVTSLAGRFDFTGYIAPTSDIVALMTLEHQTRVVNLMIRAGWDARVNAAPAAIDADIEALVRYMLFADEAKLYDPIEGVSTFAKTFNQRGPRDRQGRSLRDFDMNKRMFRYPLSFMLYSATFDALPDAVREKVYRRIFDVLKGQDQAQFSRLTDDDRKAVLEIVRETKTGLPGYWRE
jgi:hypothetical protein